jgi:hypothetical protein
LRIEAVAWSAQRIPTVVNLGFLDRSRYFFLSVTLQLSSKGYMEEIAAAPVKETETNGLGDPLRRPRNTLYPQKLAVLRQQAAVAPSAY